MALALGGRPLKLSHFGAVFSSFLCRASNAVDSIWCVRGRNESTYSGQSNSERKAPGRVLVGASPGLFGQPFHITHPHLMKPGEVTPGISKGELQNRRSKLMEAATASSPWPGCHHVLLLPAAEVTYMSDGIAHPFRQCSDLLYMSGCLEPESLLLLHTGPRRAAPAHTSLLFVAADSPDHRLWEGGRTGASPAAAALFGVDRVLPISELCAYMECLAREVGRAAVWYDFRPTLAAPLNTTVRDFLGVCAGSRLESPRGLVQRLRLIKSPAEQRLMRAAANVATAAVSAAMTATQPHIGEHQVQAAVEHVMRSRGSQRPAFPPVVAGGWRSTIIHYTRNDHVLTADEHVLIDVGCELNGYCSDVSRCWPVGQRFSSAQQEVYERLLHVQAELLDVVRNTRPTLDTLYACMLRLLSQQIVEMGLVGWNRQRSHPYQSVQRYCPHHVGHYLGMDVHDTNLMPKNTPLKPGMCITVEPGIYIPRDDTDSPVEYRGLGFRIEDMVLITDGGCEVLTSSCPKSTQDVAQRRS